MFQDIHNITQEVKAKQACFQAQVDQARVAETCVVTGHFNQPERRRPHFLALLFRLERQPR
jgi:hypothetical protein